MNFGFLLQSFGDTVSLNGSVYIPLNSKRLAINLKAIKGILLDGKSSFTAGGAELPTFVLYGSVYLPYRENTWIYFSPQILFPAPHHHK
jgi:hypothetical protein